MRLRVLAALFLLTAGSASLWAGYNPPREAVALIDSMAARLDISREVAWAKYQKHVPINDPAREAAVLSSLQERGGEMGLSEGAVAALFEAQFRASKELQTELIAGWRGGRPAPRTPPLDLQRQIRPALDQISTRMLGEWRQILPRLPSRKLLRYAGRVLHERGFSCRVSTTAAGPLG